MNKPKEAGAIPDKPGPNKEPRGIRAARLLFNTATFAAAVIACAIGGPKLPPAEGD